VDRFLRFAFRFRLVLAFRFLAMFHSFPAGFRTQRQTDGIKDCDNLPRAGINPSNW
jgi:hypothetical protein